MAAEFSRELGVKSYEGQKRLAQLGFKMGGVAGYGLRRMLLSSTGQKIRMLRTGEHKSIATDRVVLVPGPRTEVEVVRRIYAIPTPVPIAESRGERGQRNCALQGTTGWSAEVL